MTLSARAAVTVSGGRLVELRSDGALQLRPSDECVRLVAGAGGPLGGDDWRLDLTVGAGDGLMLRATAATVALPGRGGQPSRFTVTARVGAGGRLDVDLLPTVAAHGCRHVAEVLVTLARDAELVWREELVLGRAGESAGDLVSRVRVDDAEGPLWRSDLAVGPHAPAGAAVLGGAHCVGQVLLVGPNPPAAWVGDGVAVLPLARGGAVVTALAPDAATLRKALDRALRRQDQLCNGPLRLV